MPFPRSFSLIHALVPLERLQTFMYATPQSIGAYTQDQRVVQADTQQQKPPPQQQPPQQQQQRPQMPQIAQHWPLPHAKPQEWGAQAYSMTRTAQHPQLQMGQPKGQLPAAIPMSAGGGSAGTGEALGVMSVPQNGLAEGACGSGSPENMHLAQQYTVGAVRPAWGGYMCAPSISSAQLQDGRLRLVEASMRMGVSESRAGGPGSEGTAARVSGGTSVAPGGSYHENAESVQPPQGQLMRVANSDKHHQQQGWGSPNPPGSTRSCSAEEVDLLVAAADAGRRKAAAYQPAPASRDQMPMVPVKGGNGGGDTSGGNSLSKVPSMTDGNGAPSFLPTESAAPNSKPRTGHGGDGSRDPKAGAVVDLADSGTNDNGKAARRNGGVVDGNEEMSGKREGPSRSAGRSESITDAERHPPSNGGTSNGTHGHDQQRRHQMQSFRGVQFPRESEGKEGERYAVHGAKGGVGGGPGMTSASVTSSHVEIVKHVNVMQHQPPSCKVVVGNGVSASRKEQSDK